ncbi:MAG TPA: formylglycine-generating enzyme family protein [Nitrospiria bacterium]|nr:formylglycine-generating enzyme family protein [Nitrospiria bacterium]
MDKGWLVVAAVVIAVAAAVLFTTSSPGEPPEGMVLIPGGTFLMGSRGDEGKLGFEVGVDEMPQHSVRVRSFFMDRTEVTNAQYQKFIEVSGRPAPADPKDVEYYAWVDGKPPAGQEEHPVCYVAWADADAYCRWVGKRLPTEAEWERAARGDDNRIWPWGNTFDPTRCNTTEAGFRWSTPVGSFPEGASPYGVLDLCGNVAEWTSSWYEPYPGSTLQRAAFGRKMRVARGGAWVLTAQPWSRTTNRNLAQPPDLRHRTLGFRCVK